MTVYFEALIASVLLGVGILISVYLFEFVRKFLYINIDYLVSLVGGVLSGIVFYGFIPEILDNFGKGNYSPKLIGLSIFLGIVIFFIIELFFHFHHCKDLNQKENVHKHFSDKLILIGTFIHNLLHGIVLYTGFLINLKFGILLTISIFLHSIPQNIANYIMNYKDFKRVIIAGFSSVIGTIFLYPFLDFVISNKIYILSMISGMIIYLIISDILPEFKNRLKVKLQFLYLFFWLIGFLLFFLLEWLSEIIL